MKKHLSITVILFGMHSPFTNAQTQDELNNNSTGKWPDRISGTKVIFTPKHPLWNFVDKVGIDITGNSSDFFENRNIFTWLPIDVSNDNRNCGPSAPKGYVHTSSYLIDQLKPFSFKIGFPIRFKMKTNITGERKSQILNTPLINVAAYRNDAETLNLIPLKSTDGHTTTTAWWYLIKSFCGPKDHCDDLNAPLEIDFQAQIISPEFTANGQNRISVRVLWEKAGICGLQGAELAIGNQIRLIHFHPFRDTEFFRLSMG
jgi:hypothetical protein